MKTRLPESILLHSGARQRHRFITNPLPAEQVWIISLKSMHYFWGKLRALKRVFREASVPTEKLPQLAQMKQGGEQLKLYLISFWDLDTLISTTGRTSVKIQNLEWHHQRFLKHSWRPLLISTVDVCPRRQGDTRWYPTCLSVGSY